MSKFARLYEYACESGWVAEDKSNLFSPDELTRNTLSLCHDPDYLQKLQDNALDSAAWRRIGLPWSRGLIKRTFTAPNGTLLTAELALQNGIACHLAGGTHHAHYDFGSGFCMVNDLAFAGKSLIESGLAQRILIFDCDVHQGDGTAALLQDQPDIFTCSIHCEKNFPFRKQISDLDIGLDMHLSDTPYLETVLNTLDSLLSRLQPDIVLYDAGVDVWKEDSLGRLDISWQGIERRDAGVLKACAQRDIPVATVIGGGYDSDHARLAMRHGIIIDAAQRISKACYA